MNQYCFTQPDIVEGANHVDEQIMLECGEIDLLRSVWYLSSSRNHDVVSQILSGSLFASVITIDKIGGSDDETISSVRLRPVTRTLLSSTII